MDYSHRHLDNSVFALKKAAKTGGIVTAVGYLLLLIWTIVHSGDMFEPGPIIAGSILGCVLGLAAVATNARMEQRFKVLAVAIIGVILLVMKLVATERVLGNTGLLFGTNNGALGLGFLLLVATMACLVARKHESENVGVRYALMGLGATGLLLYLVMILVALAERSRSMTGLGAILRSGDTFLVSFASVVLLAVLAIFAIGFLAGATTGDARRLCGWGIGIGVAMFYATVGFVCLGSFILLLKLPELFARSLLDFALVVVAGLGTLFGPAYICIGSLGRAIVTMTNWRNWATPSPVMSDRSPIYLPPSLSHSAGESRRSGTPSTGNVENPLKELKSLYDQGLITEREYSEKRADILRRL